MYPTVLNNVTLRDNIIPGDESQQTAARKKSLYMLCQVTGVLKNGELFLIVWLHCQQQCEVFTMYRIEELARCEVGMLCVNVMWGMMRVTVAHLILPRMIYKLQF
jgi:hypothetical protein